MTRHVIHRIRLAHCKRGPEVCPRCREMDEVRICLLDVEPPGRGLEQRRVMIDPAGHPFCLVLAP